MRTTKKKKPIKKKAAIVKPSPELVAAMTEPHPWIKFTDTHVQKALVKLGKVQDPFKPRTPPPWAKVPKPADLQSPSPGMAMDQQITQVLNVSSWAAGSYYDGGMYAGLGFAADYAYLSLLAQLPEYRRLVEVLAVESTGQWIEIKSTSEEDKTKEDKIKELEEELERLHVQDVFRKMSELDGFFGRAHLYIDTGSTQDRPELVTDIGNGKNEATKAKFAGKKGFLRALKPIEPVWVYPTQYDAMDPMTDAWYNPQTWFVQGKEVHRSRLLTFVSREVPDLLKPAYMFGGLSLIQLSKPYVDNWLRTRQAVADLIWSFSVRGLKTNLQALMQQDGQDLFRRAAMFTGVQNNQGLMILDNDSEDFFNIETSLGSLDQLQSQAQEHMCVTAETLVATGRGQIPIIDVCSGDMVKTRNGFERVKWAGVTGKHIKEVVVLRTTTTSLRLTPCHPVYLPETDEFVPAENVKVGDHLLVDPNWGNMGRQLLGADVGGGLVKRVTIDTPNFANSYTGQCGKPTLSRFLKEWTYTTLTKTKQIIGSAISNILQEVSITPTTFVMADSGLHVSSAFLSSVRNAVNSTKHVGQNVLSSVVVSVAREITDEDVYNLEVDPHLPGIDEPSGALPEFYANGVLVHNCSVTGTPVIKLLGIQPHGMNATSEGELTSWYDWVESYQERMFTLHLKQVIDFAMLNIWGEIDKDITFEYKPLRAATPKERAEMQKMEADTDVLYVEAGILSPLEVRERIANDPETPYSGLDVDDVPETMAAPGEGELPDGQEPDPNAENPDIKGGAQKNPTHPQKVVGKGQKPPSVTVGSPNQLGTHVN